MVAMILRYIDDDRSAASKFLSSINRKVVRSRFPDASAWKPDHISLALIDGEAVAMADLVVMGDREAANAGLLAKPGFGAYAVKALLHLKMRVGIPHWQSTLRFPTSATIAISRRFFTQTYDQAAFELAGKLIELYGQHNYLHPIPLVASNEFVKMAGLPPISSWDTNTKMQVLKAASLSGSLLLQTPSGIVLPLQDVTALAFDLLETPYDVRQQFSRMAISATAAMHGHDPSPLIGRILKPSGGAQFMAAIREFGTADISGGGHFGITEVDTSRLRQDRAIPSARMP